MTPRIRPAEPSDRPALVELLRLSLGAAGGPRTEDYLAWKHEANPFGRSLMLVAEAEGRLVACRAFLRWGLLRDGEAVAAVRSVDSATHPDWRRRGLFSRLTRGLLESAAEDGVELVFNTPNRQSRPGYTQLDWRPAGRVRVRLRPVRPLAARDEHRSGALPVLPDAGAGELVAALRDPGLGHLPGPRQGAGTGYATRRDAAFLAWRYADVPGLRYHARWRRRDGAAAALVHRLRRRRGALELTVVEVLLTAGEAGRRLAAELLRELARDAAAHGVSHLLAVAPGGGGEAAALRRAGFLPPLPLGPRLVVRPLTASPPPRRWSDWRLGAGDLELF